MAAVSEQRCARVGHLTSRARSAVSDMRRVWGCSLHRPESAASVRRPAHVDLRVMRQPEHVFVSRVEPQPQIGTQGSKGA